MNQHRGNSRIWTESELHFTKPLAQAFCKSIDQMPVGSAGQDDGVLWSIARGKIFQKTWGELAIVKGNRGIIKA